MDFINILGSKALAVRRWVPSLKSTVVNKIKRSQLYVSMSDQIFRANNKRYLGQDYFIRKDGLFNKTSDYAVILHLYYVESWDTIFAERLKHLSSKLAFDLYVTMPASSANYILYIREHFPLANILITENRGRDVLPFIKAASILDNMGYKKVLKVHSKKSTHRENKGTTAERGVDWLSNTLNALIPDNSDVMNKLMVRLRDPATGMIGAFDYYYPLKMYLSHNLVLIRRVINVLYPDFSNIMTAQRLDAFGFFGGTMFWVDLDSIRGVLHIAAANFEPEGGQTDGTLAHALERVFCMVAQSQKKNIYGVHTKGIVKVEKPFFPDWYYDDISGGKPCMSIIVPVYADWESLSKNIKSLIKYVGDLDDVSVHYVNDCGPEADRLELKIVERIRSITNFYYYRNDKNLGFIKTCNRASLQLTPQNNDVLLLNSDTKVTRDFAAAMKRVLYSEDNIGAVTARSNNATIWSVPRSGRFADYQLFSYMLYLYLSKRIPEKYITPTVHGFCVLIRRSVIRSYGMFDEVYGRGYAEENDFAMRILKHGWKCAVANRAFVFHYESRSFGNTERKQQIDKNEVILLERYPNYRKLVQEYWNATREPLR